MKRLLLGTLTLWGLLLSPALCLGGVLQHACIECDAVSCAHERDCGDDPCNESVIRSQSDLQQLVETPPAVLPSVCRGWHTTLSLPPACGSPAVPMPPGWSQNPLPLLL
jgi:hypothetical protein